MTARAYVRVSSEEQARSGLSLADQEARLRRYAAEYALGDVIVYRDAGISAKTLRRPGLERLLGDLAPGDHLIVTALDRLTRSLRDLFRLVEEVLPQRQTALHSLREHVDTATALGRYFLATVGAIAQLERELIGERTRAALAAKRARGEPVNGSRPYGVTPAERQIRRRIHALSARGLTRRAIAARLNALGHRARHGGPWAASTVTAILRRKVIT